MFRRQINIFFAILTFFTRIPAPRSVHFSEEYLNRGVVYFPLMGWIVGGVAAITYIAASYIPPQSISILLSMISTILLTGAFHEDGFADFCDGFGGGYSKEQIITIMRDSRIGTYGSIGLVSILALKYLSLMEIESTYLIITFISGHSLSRFISASIIYSYDYIAIEGSKSKPLATKMTSLQLLIAGLFGLIPLLLFNNYIIFIILIPIILIRFYFGYYISKWLGGYTGDCLGAVQQLSEVSFYIIMVTYPWKLT